MPPRDHPVARATHEAKSICVGLVADPAAPTTIARRLHDLEPPDGAGVARWDVEVNASLDHRDLFVLAWFVASAATVGGGLGSGLESGEAIRRAACSKREEERRSRLARDRS